VPALAATSPQARVEGNVSDHDYSVWPDLVHDRLEGDHDAGCLLGVGARSGAQVAIWPPDAEVSEEDLVHGVVVVLAGVDQHHVGPPRLQRVHDRLDLHEIGARACHADDLQDFRRFTSGLPPDLGEYRGCSRRRCGGTVEVAGGDRWAVLPLGQRREARARA